jgi:TctA family transporter
VIPSALQTLRAGHVSPPKASARARMLDEVVRRGTFVGLTVGMMPGTMAALPAVVARRAAMADASAKSIASGVRVVPGINADIGSDKPHGVYPTP